MPTYAAGSQVSIERSRAEVERTLARYGATTFSYGNDGNRHVVVFELNGRRVRFDVLMPELAEFHLTPTHKVRTDASARQMRDQAMRQRWRALVLIIKAKLEAIEAGIVTAEEEFLAHTMLPDGSKVVDWMEPQLVEVYASGQMPALLPGGRPELMEG